MDKKITDAFQIERMRERSGMNKLYLVFLLLTGLILGSCFNKNGFDDSTDWFQDELKDNARALSQKGKEIVKNHCIVHPFAQGQDLNLYGRFCIEGKHLFIQTDKKGKAVVTSASIGSENSISNKSSSDYADGLRTEGKLGFINRVYDSQYKILKGKGSDNKIPFLRNFLPENLKLFGSLNTRYKVFFEIEGNYLVLYKASQRLDDIPYTERTSGKQVVKTEKGRKVKYHVVPFLGYPIQYCIAEPEQNRQDEDTNKYRRECNPSHSDKAPYLHIVNKPEPYEYIIKQDLYPSDYFTGEWFFAEGSIQAPSDENEIPAFSAHLVKFVRRANSLEIIDVSGNIEDRNREPRGEIHIDWRDYKMDKVGDKIIGFREVLHEFDNKIRMPYLLIRKPYYIKTVEKSEDLESDIVKYLPKKIDLTEENSDIEVIRVAKDFWSMTLQITDGNNIFKHKYSFYRRTAVDERNFVSRRWFEDDDRYFGVLYIEPQTVGEAADFKTSDLQKNRRIIRFNTDNQDAVIKWYFSKNTPKDNPLYRDLAREAIQIYDQAFKTITKGTGKRIRVELVEGEDKDLGDLRYNIINLVKSKDLFQMGSGLLGIAPSFVNPDTGQIVGTTANIFLHTFLELGHVKVRDYIRHRIFQTDEMKEATEEKDESYVVSPYLRSQIKKECDEVEEFIEQEKMKLARGEINQQSELDDKKILISCSEKISRNPILAIILHEMGHSFGLSHNFKASFDQNNFWTSEAEMKASFPNARSFTPKLPKSSSVMDYLPPLSVPNLTVLGKYDLAVLKFLYMNQFEYRDQMETFFGIRAFSKNTLSVEVSEDLSQQKPFSQHREILPNKKAYLHCPTWVPTKGENFLCFRYDHGSTPLEMINFFIQRLKYHFNRRYRYDQDPRDFGFLSDEKPGGIGEKRGFIEAFFELTDEILELHSHWIELRDHYLTSTGNRHKTDYIILEDDKNFIEEYKTLIEVNPPINSINGYSMTSIPSAKGGEIAEYNNYYDIREPIYRWAEYLLFFETMKCKVEDNKGGTHFIDLDLIKQHIVHEYNESLYVEDCNSEMLKDFLEEEKGLKLVGQKGMENFLSYYHKSDKEDVIPLFFLIEKFQHTRMYFKNGVRKFHSLAHRFLNEVVTDEPDFFDQFRVKAESWILERDDLSQVDLETMIDFYYKAMELMFRRLENYNSDVFENNQNYLDVVSFHTGGGEHSFSDIYDKVRGQDHSSSRVEDIGIPFLTEAHQKYMEQQQAIMEEQQTMDLTESDQKYNPEYEQQTQEFKDYLIGLDETMTDANLFYIPFQSHNFALKLVVKYNENLRKIKSLEDKSNRSQLSFLEIIEIERRRKHNEIFKRTIKDHARVP